MSSGLKSYWRVLPAIILGGWTVASRAATQPGMIPPGVPEPGLVIWGAVVNQTNASQAIAITSANWSVTDGVKTAVYSATSHPPVRIVELNGASYYILQVPFDTRQVGTVTLADPATVGRDSFELKGASPPTYTLVPTINGALANVRSIDGAPASGSNFPLAGFTSATRGRVIRVDLAIVPPASDYEAWAAAIFGNAGNPEAARTADPDEDGLNNESEHVAGTDPKDPDSALRILEFHVRNQPQPTVLGWQSASNRRYIIESATRPDGPWVALGEPVPGTGAATQVSIDSPADDTFVIGSGSRPKSATRIDASMSMPSYPAIVRFLCLSLLVGGTTGSLRAATQTFSLAAQWNLISFQLIPDNPDPQAVFSSLPGFQAAWTYDASLALWHRHIKAGGTTAQQTNDTTANALIALPPIQPGRAYWVFTSQAVPDWQVNGTVPVGATFPSLDLKAGWNLVGIPLGATSTTNTEPVSLLAILTAAGFDYDALLTWENQTFRKMFRPQLGGPNDPPSPLEGLPPDLPFPAFNLQQDLSRGYWIRVLDPAVLRPRLVTTVRPDMDAEPISNFPSKEDLNVSGGPQAKNVHQQDVIRFFPGEDIQTLGVANLGDGSGGGGGILIWEALWTPTTDTHTPEPWVRLFASPDQREQRDQNGNLLSAHTTLSGVTTLENDTVYLRLDRRNLGRGIHEGTLLLRTSVGDKTYQVVAEVPGLEGDYKGYAVIQSVNGKRNPVPDIDLNVSFYEDNKVAGLLRGLIDSSQALLWPVDVPLVGYRVADEGNRFMLSGSFVLPPGDQNGEPFDRWKEGDPDAGMDVDWLNDGTLDVRNPFPFPIQRTVSFQGSLITANPTDGYIVEGEYRELVYGMAREPIRLSGTFHLERQAVRPLSSRRSVTQDTGVEPVIEKRNTTPLLIPPGATRDSAVSVQTELELHSLQVTLTFNAPLAHSTFLIKLVAPASNPTEITLYDGRTAAGAINPKLLEKLTLPLDRPTYGDLGQFLREVPKTRTDSASVQFWKLVIVNAGAQSVTLANWTLRLEGQPVSDVVGVVKDGVAPLAGVRVGLDGVPFSQFSGVSDAQGRFVLSRVPLLPLNFTAARPGYLPADPARPGLSPLFTRPFVGQDDLTFSPIEAGLIERFNYLAGAPVALAGVPGFVSGTVDSPFELNLRPEASGTPKIAAGPLVAFAGSTIEFDAVNAASTAFWDFGDQDGTNATVATHEYPTPGYYRVRLFSPADSATPQDTVNVVVLPSPRRALTKPSDLKGEPTGLDLRTASAAYDAHLFQPFLTSAGVLPAHKVGVDPMTGADRYLSDITPQSSFGQGETNVFGAAYVSAVPLQMAYTASFDLDLAPHTSPAGTTKPFPSDGFVALASPGFNPSININNQGFKEEDFNYSLVASLWQNTRAGDGSVEYTQDAQNGLIVWGNLQESPSQNYSTRNSEARDGGIFTVALDEDLFHPHQGTTFLPDLATHQTVMHYRMMCSLGAAVLTAPTSAASVKAAKPRRGEPDNPLDAPLYPSSPPAARNLFYQLNTGFLGTQVAAP